MAAKQAADNAVVQIHEQRTPQDSAACAGGTGINGLTTKASKANGRQMTRLRLTRAREVPAWRKEAFERFSAAAELPMLILAVVMIPVIIIPLVNSHLSPAVQNVIDAVDYFIWGVFALEYVTKLTLAPRRGHFVVHNVPDLVIVAVPMLRPLRIVRSVRVLRALRLTRLTAFAGEGARKSRRALHTRVLNYLAVVTTLLVLVTSVLVWDLERAAPGASIKTWPESVWWAVTTITTVGYGDKTPVTAGGRAVAAVLMFVGIGLIAVITAGIATMFIKSLGGPGQPARPNVLEEGAVADIPTGCD